MSVVGDLIEGVVQSALSEVMNKAGLGRRARRRRRTTLTATERLRRIEKLLKPARKQTSRKRTVRSRSKVKRRGY